MHSFIYLYTNVDGNLALCRVSWEIIHLEPELEELRVYIDQNGYSVILGCGFLDKFVYIPDIGIGFPADNLDHIPSSVFFLSEKLEETDAFGIAISLQQYASGYVKSNKVFSC